MTVTIDLFQVLLLCGTIVGAAVGATAWLSNKLEKVSERIGKLETAVAVHKVEIKSLQDDQEGLSRAVAAGGGR